jgi:hypothetical protein
MPPVRHSRACIDERNIDQLEMTGAALCSKSFIAGDTQLVTGSSSSIHQGMMQQIQKSMIRDGFPSAKYAPMVFRF